MNENLKELADLVGRELAKRWLKSRYPTRLDELPDGFSSKERNEISAVNQDLLRTLDQENKTKGK